MNPFLKKPNLVRVARAVGWVTFLEIIRDKVLYNIFLCSCLLLGVGFLAGRLTFIRPERVVLNLGFSSVAVSCAAIAILTGSSLIGKELDRRTIYVALCHPISRTQFVFGKFFGLIGVIFLNWLLLNFAYVLILGTSSEQGWQSLSLSLVIGSCLLMIQSMLLSSVAIFFSSFSTTSLSVIFSVGVFLIGNNISQIRLVAERLGSPVGRGLLHALSYVLPNLEYFNLGTQVTYGLPVSFAFVASGLAYGLITSIFFLVLAGLLIQGREV